MATKMPMRGKMPMRPAAKKRRYTEAQDKAYDRAHGIKEGSARDKALDRKRGLPAD